jgi:hypothetical protein
MAINGWHYVSSIIIAEASKFKIQLKCQKIFGIKFGRSINNSKLRYNMLITAVCICGTEWHLPYIYKIMVGFKVRFLCIGSKKVTNIDFVYLRHYNKTIILLYVLEDELSYVYDALQIY